MRDRQWSATQRPESQLARLRDKIIIHHHRDPNIGITEVRGEIAADRYHLSVALCHGRATITSDGVTLHDGLVFPGMMRLAAPGEKVCGHIYTRSEAVIFDIPKTFLQSALRGSHNEHQAGIPSHACALLQPNTSVEQLGRLALRINEVEPAHSQLFVGGIVQSLLAFLLLPRGLAPREPQRRESLGPEKVRQAIEFAEFHLGRALRLQDWAYALGMPAPEFARRFRAIMGISPYAWFLRRRIERARELLCDTDAPLCDIALEVGFCSQSHFTEAFRRQVGMSPALWRRARRTGI